MNVAIISRDDEYSKQIEQKLATLLKSAGLIRNDEQPDVVIFVGGDGTFLRAVNHFLDRINELKFIGIHTGSLGFFCDFAVDDLVEVVALIKEEKPHQRRYRLLEACLSTEKSSRLFYAVNEIRIENAQHTIISDVHIDDLYLETFRGNGLLVSSQLGSSGYNKSIGGAIIESGLELLELSEIAPLSNNIYRPLNASLVLRGNRVVTFSGVAGQTILGYDHLSEKINADNFTLKVRLGEKKVTLIHNQNRPYLLTLHKAFINS